MGNQISGEYSQNSNNNGAFKSLTRNTGSGFQRTQLTMRQNDSNGNLSYNSNYVENQVSVNRYLSTPQPILDNQSSNNFAMSKFPEKSSNKNYRNVRPSLPSQSEIFFNQQKVQGANLNRVENRDLRMRSNDQLFLNNRKTSQGDHNNQTPSPNEKPSYPYENHIRFKQKRNSNPINIQSQLTARLAKFHQKSKRTDKKNKKGKCLNLIW